MYLKNHVITFFNCLLMHEKLRVRTFYSTTFKFRKCRKVRRKCAIVKLFHSDNIQIYKINRKITLIYYNFYYFSIVQYLFLLTKILTITFFSVFFR